MKVEIDEITSVKKSLKVVIPQEIVSEAYIHAYADLSKKVKVPGFRLGKVPVSLLEKKYGPSVTDDIIRKLVPDYYQKAVEEAGIFPVDMPSFENIEAKKDAPMSFTATVEVRPKIVLSGYGDIPVPRKPLKVADEEVEKTLEHERESQGQLEACAEDYPIVSNDYAIINFDGTIEGKTVEGGKNEGYTIQLGSKTFPEPFESSLLGKKKGDRFNCEVSYPEDFQNKTIAGQTIHFDIEVVEVKKKVLPARDDEFAKDLGHASLDAYKVHLKELLLKQKENQQEQEQKKVLVDQLITTHPFEVPSSLVSHELQTMMDYFQNPESKPEDTQTLMKELEPLAARRVKEALILNEIAKQEKIEVSDAEVEDEIVAMAKRRGFPVQEMKQKFYQKEGAVNGLKSQIKESKALDLVFSKARFEDVVEKGEKS